MSIYQNILTQLFGLSGNNEQLSYPCGIAIDSHDNVYVTPKFKKSM